MGSSREKDRHLWTHSMHSGIAQFASFRDTLMNVHSAFMERIYYHMVDGVPCPPYVPKREYVIGTLKQFASDYSQYVRQRQPLDCAEFAALYTGRRRRLYELAAERVVERGVTRADAKINAFLKHEKIRIVQGKRLVPRVIQPRKPEYNVAVGRYIKPIEHEVYGIIAKVMSHGRSKIPVVMKGYNAFQVAGYMRAAWEEFRCPTAVGLDASRFDQHVSAPLLAWEHGIYLKHYRNGSELKRLLGWQLCNKGAVHVHDGDVRYSTLGTRCSGDMNTALGNCLIMTACVDTYLRRKGIQGRVFNNGDDCVVMMEQGLEDKFKEGLDLFFKDIGFVMKVEPPVFRFEHLEFCQTHPVFDGSVWRMVRDPRVTFSKDATMLWYPRSQKEWDGMRGAIGLCGLSLTRGIPMAQSYYLALSRGATKRCMDERIRETGMFQLAKGLELSGAISTVTAEARVSFWHAFQITVDQQMNFERAMDLETPDEYTQFEGGFVRFVI